MLCSECCGRGGAPSAVRAVLLLWLALGARGEHTTRYAFYRSMRSAEGVEGAEGAEGAEGGGKAEGARRVYGGAAVALGAFPAACALLDRYWAPRCSGAVLAPHWVLTAAHCVAPHVAYVQYNARQPAAGDVAAAHFLYRHPGYQVLQEDEGRGPDVTLLHHDVGLVRTRQPMRLATPPAVEPLRAMRLYDLDELRREEVEVLGFGRTERDARGEELCSVRLLAVACERREWRHCVCGVARRAARGVCSGDSGGPVLFRGAQVGVTSMGPTQCSAAGMDPPEGATSVFTALFHYADLVNGTMSDTEATLRMKRIDGPTAGGAALASLAPLLAPLLAVALSAPTLARMLSVR